MDALDFQLTNREQEVLHLVAEGYTDRRIAQSLIISPRTVNRHLSNIFVKLAVPHCCCCLCYPTRINLILSSLRLDGHNGDSKASDTEQQRKI